MVSDITVNESQQWKEKQAQGLQDLHEEIVLSHVLPSPDQTLNPVAKLAIALGRIDPVIVFQNSTQGAFFRWKATAGSVDVEQKMGLEFIPEHCELRLLLLTSGMPKIVTLSCRLSIIVLLVLTGTEAADDTFS